MDTIFMNSKTIYPKRLLLNLADKIYFRRGENSFALLNLSIYYK